MCKEVVNEVHNESTIKKLMDWVILNSIKQVENDFDMEVDECLVQLQATQVENTTNKIEELSETK